MIVCLQRRVRYFYLTLYKKKIAIVKLSQKSMLFCTLFHIILYGSIVLYICYFNTLFRLFKRIR